MVSSLGGTTLNQLTDNQLINSLDQLVRREREILAEVLQHFKEFDRRKLFSKLGYASLHEYAVKHLKYSDDQAYRRVQAMRLMRDIPEIESKIEEGALTLSNLSQAQNYFRKVEHSKDEKIEVLAKLENATKNEASKIFRQGDKVRFSFEADSQLESVIDTLRGLHPHLTFDELAKKVFEVALASIDPATKNRAVMKPRATITGDRAVSIKRSSETRPRYIPINVKREVWFRAQGKCQNCNSTFALEYDHIIPFAKGGQSIKENLRVLCRNCNLRKAIEHYGVNKVNRPLSQ